MVYYSNNLTLFSSEIDLRRNLFIDDIEQYLASLSSTVTLDDFKRFTPSETVSVRVSVTDAQMAFGAYLTSRWNYARVLYEDDSLKNSYFWYYFVTSIEMVADGTLAISLQLDALNTFRNWKGALTDRTFVTRQLVKRWNSLGRYDASLITSEDIQGKTVKYSENYIAKDAGYLVYRNTTGGKPALYAVKSTAMKCHDSMRFDGSMFVRTSTGAGYGFQIVATGATVITLNYVSSTSGSGTLTKAISSGESFKVGYSTYNPSGYYITCFEFGDEKKVVTDITAVDFSAEGSFTGGWYQCENQATGGLSWTLIGDSAISLSDVNRTDSDIAKIIEIPYFGDISGGYFGLRDSSTIAYQYDSLEPSISKKIATISLPAQWKVAKGDIASTAEGAKTQDPKIYSGQFCWLKFVYDSFYASIALENLPALAVSSDERALEVTFTASSTMSSSSIFRISCTWGEEQVEEDYPFLVASTRNNEIPLFSSEWYNYLRNGYNYDMKSNAVNLTASLLSTVGTIASLAVGGPMGAVSAIGMGSAAVSAWANTANTMNAQAAKETQLQRQSVSASAINDLSLFKEYGKGAMKYVLYIPSKEFRLRLQDLFFYRGYSVNRQYEPSLDVRTSFDYIECVPSWSGSFIQRTPPQFISLLNDRLAQGVTIIHHYENAWDIAQEKGNLEK